MSKTEKELVTFMKKIFSIFLIIIFICSFTNAFSDEKFQTGDNVKITETHSDNIYLAGESISIENSIFGDTFIAGNEIIISTHLKEDVFAAGGTIVLENFRAEDVRVAGGEVEVSSIIIQDLIVAGGKVLVTPEADVSRDALIFGGEIDFQGSVAGDLIIKGGKVFFDGVVEGDATIEAKEVHFGDNARIEGNLDLKANSYAIDDSKVLGTVSYSSFKEDVEEKFSILFMGIGSVIAGFFRLVIWITFAIITLLFCKSFFEDSVKKIYANILKTGLHGLLFMIIAPVVIGLLFVTIIGIPIALLVLFAYAIMFCYAHVIGIYFGGDYIISKLLKKKWNFWGTFILGLLVFGLLRIIPFMGGVVNLAVVLIGLGIIYEELHQKLSKSKKGVSDKVLNKTARKTSSKKSSTKSSKKTTKKKK